MEINHEAYMNMLYNIDFEFDIHDYFADYEREDCILAMKILRDKYKIYPMSHEIHEIWSIHSDDWDASWLVHSPEYLVGLVINLIKLYSENVTKKINPGNAISEALKITTRS